MYKPPHKGVGCDSLTDVVLWMRNAVALKEESDLDQCAKGSGVKSRQNKLPVETLPDPRALTSESQSRMGMFQVKGIFVNSIMAFIKRFCESSMQGNAGVEPHGFSMCEMVTHRDSLIFLKLWLPGNLEACLSDVRERPACGVALHWRESRQAPLLHFTSLGKERERCLS